MPDQPAKSSTHEEAAAALYVGEVMHARLKPMGHRFSYRVMSLLIDLDRLDAADRQSALFAVNRMALASTKPIMARATGHPCAFTRNAARRSTAST